MNFHDGHIELAMLHAAIARFAWIEPESNERRYHIIGPGVATIRNEGDDKCVENARLIAAAPELLEALNESLLFMTASLPSLRDERSRDALRTGPITTALAAIAKARGEER